MCSLSHGLRDLWQSGKISAKNSNSVKISSRKLKTFIHSQRFWRIMREIIGFYRLRL
jgi:hypothetical protein